MFRIGQRVVWVGQGGPKEVTILDIKPNDFCNCPDVLIRSSNIKSDFGYGFYSCGCGFKGYCTPGLYRYSRHFRPLSDNYAEEVLSKVKESVDENLELLELIKQKEQVK